MDLISRSFVIWTATGGTWLRSREGASPKSCCWKLIQNQETKRSKIGGTRSFLSGPADPVHNPHITWYHVCKKNFSIKSKGPYEILRQHWTERNLRRDQWWRDEHLKSIDPISGKVQHRVRCGKGQVLSKKELAKEMPIYIHLELVEIGEKSFSPRTSWRAPPPH